MATVNDYLISRKFNLSSCDPDNTLYVIFGGGNDVIQAIYAGVLTNQTLEQILVATLPYLVKFITSRIVNAGGRHVVVFNLASLSVQPLSRASLSPEQLEKVKNLTITLNDAIANQIANLPSSGADVRLYDTYDFWIDAFENPEKYGFRNSTGYCFQNWEDFLDGSAKPGEQAIVCKEPGEYLFWDAYGHPTTKLHEVWSDDIEKQMGWK